MLEERRGALETSLRELAEDGRATFGVYFKDLTEGATIRRDADHVMHAASLMKVPILLEALRRVDSGKLRLEDELPVANEFKSIVDDSSFSIQLDPPTDGPTMGKLGTTASVEFLAREMIMRSSNLATNVLLSHLGAEAVQRFTNELGAESVKVRRCVEDPKAYQQGINNETDAAGIGIVMEAALRSPRLSGTAHAKVWQILTGQTFNDQIPAGIPKSAGAIVGHKTGFISSVQHDAAIVHLRDGRDYVLVILATDFGANDAGRKRVKQTSRRMSRAVFEAMTAPE
jgi:beta-lactamase class A